MTQPTLTSFVLGIENERNGWSHTTSDAQSEQDLPTFIPLEPEEIDLSNSGLPYRAKLAFRSESKDVWDITMDGDELLRKTSEDPSSYAILGQYNDVDLIEDIFVKVLVVKIWGMVVVHRQWADVAVGMPELFGSITVLVSFDHDKEQIDRIMYAHRDEDPADLQELRKWFMLK